MAEDLAQRPLMSNLQKDRGEDTAHCVGFLGKRSGPKTLVPPSDHLCRKAVGMFGCAKTQRMSPVPALVLLPCPERGSQQRLREQGLPWKCSPPPASGFRNTALKDVVNVVTELSTGTVFIEMVYCGKQQLNNGEK